MEQKQTKKKKADIEALQSALMRIPRMDVTVARELIDTGIREIYQLQGRSPESLLAEIRKKKPKAGESSLPYIRLAVYFAETNLADLDKAKLHPSAWA